MLGTRNPNHKGNNGERFNIDKTKPVDVVEIIEKVEKAEKVEKVEKVKSTFEEPKEDVLTSEDLYELTKSEQIELLTKFGLSRKQIKALKFESDRVDAILELNS